MSAPIRRKPEAERLDVRLSLMVTAGTRANLDRIAEREGLAMNVVLRTALAVGLPIVEREGLVKAVDTALRDAKA